MHVFFQVSEIPNAQMLSMALPSVETEVTLQLLLSSLVTDNDDCGPWYKVLEYGGDTYVPTADSVGELSAGNEPIGFAKLSDEEINQLAGATYFIRLMSSTNDHFAYAHVDGLPYKDTHPSMGYRGKNEMRIAAAPSFATGHDKDEFGNPGVFDTFPTSGDGPARWFCKDECFFKQFSKISDIKLIPQTTVGRRSFNTGGLAKRRNVTVWVKPV